MKVTIFGGTGFVGSHLVDQLVEQGIQPRLLVRPGHEDRVRHPDICEVVHGDVSQPRTVITALEGSDAVVYNIGILREIRSQGLSFDELHLQAARRVMDAATQLGIRRFVLMSANGVRVPGTPYQETKFRAEEFARHSGMDVTIFRPSVIFGPGDSFFNRFAGLLRLSPGFFPLACPDARFAPVYVGDVAEAFARSLDDPATFGQHYDLCGPRAFTLRELVAYTADNIGRPTRILGLGDAASRLQARLLGEPTRKLLWVVYLLASVLTATAVSIAGNIGFVGLIVPHLMRLLVGSDHRVLFPAAALFGGLFLVLSDTLARTALAPRQLPVGVVTALLGVPTFLLLLQLRRDR